LILTKFWITGVCLFRRYYRLLILLVSTMIITIFLMVIIVAGERVGQGGLEPRGPFVLEGLSFRPCIQCFCRAKACTSGLGASRPNNCKRKAVRNPRSPGAFRSSRRPWLSCKVVASHYQIFNDVKMGKSVNIEIQMPRVCKRQTQWENFISENSEIYFKCSTFIPFLGYLIESMDTRFNQRLIDVMPLEGLIPADLNIYMTMKILLELLKYMPKISLMILHL
jgi:hypothetical protein